MFHSPTNAAPQSLEKLEIRLLSIKGLIRKLHFSPTEARSSSLVILPLNWIYIKIK